MYLIIKLSAIHVLTYIEYSISFYNAAFFRTLLKIFIFHLDSCALWHAEETESENISIGRSNGSMSEQILTNKKYKCNAWV